MRLRPAAALAILATTLAGPRAHAAPPPAEPALTISADALLYEAAQIFQKQKVDNLVVVEADRPVGLLDVQDLVRMGLLG